MIYSYSPEAAKRFDEAMVYRDTDFQKSADAYLDIIRDFADDSGVLAKAYYFLAEAVALQSNFADCEKYCQLSIEHGKKSGNIRCQNLSIIKLSGLKIDQHNEALAAEYLYEALELLKKNKDEDLIDIVHMLLGSLFDKAGDYATALTYYQQGMDELLSEAPNSKMDSSFVYCTRVLAIAECYIKLKQYEPLLKIYNDLTDVPYETIPPVCKVALTFLEGYLAYLRNDRTNAVAIMRQTLTDYKNTAEVFDTFFIPENIYQVFESYGMSEEQKEILDLLKNYCDTTNVDTWQFLYTELKIRYCKASGDNFGLLEAYESYYSTQQTYHNNSQKQKQEYIKLRKRLYEEETEYQEKLENLSNLSATDSLTGLNNRHALLKYIPSALRRALNNKQPLGVLLIDIDCYKQYNDTYGHVAGDKCLQILADVFREVLADHFCARYGGDEFICIFSALERAQIQMICQEIHDKVLALQLPHSGNQPHGIVTLSMGCSVRIPETEDDFIIFLKEADGCLYRSKDKGRNHIEFY